jgi:hypothetical protein
MEVKISNEQLFKVIKKAVSEVFDEKLSHLKLKMIPYVDDNEIKEIEEIFGSPKKIKNQKFLSLSSK